MNHLFSVGVAGGQLGRHLSASRRPIGRRWLHRAAAPNSARARLQQQPNRPRWRRGRVHGAGGTTATDCLRDADSLDSAQRDAGPAARARQVLRLANRINRERAYATPVRVGAAGGIGTPDAAVAAFSLGAAYVVTGSINQASVEANTSPAAKRLRRPDPACKAHHW
jgi:hypothetical protein